eukprot:9143644-Alexandrium_andersonii.AAC.1
MVRGDTHHGICAEHAGAFGSGPLGGPARRDHGGLDLAGALGLPLDPADPGRQVPKGVNADAGDGHAVLAPPGPQL